MEKQDIKSTAAKLGLITGLAHLPTMFEEIRAWREASKLFGDTGIVNKSMLSKIRNKHLATELLLSPLATFSLGMISYGLGRLLSNKQNKPAESGRA